MHRNTLLLISVLAVLAALLIGIRIGQKFIPTTPTQTTPPPLPSPASQPVTMLDYTNTYCGVSLSYPSSLTKLDSTASAMFVDPSNASSSVALVCQRNIPRPQVASGSAETISIASLSARLYHDTSGPNKTPIDKIMFTNPKTGLEVLIEGFGPTFQNIISSIKIL